MYYIGSHWGGTENDGYICSSNRMRDAYRRRPTDFKRKTIERIYCDRKYLLERENYWLNLAKKKPSRYYNLKFDVTNITNYTRKGKTHTEAWRLQASKRMKIRWTNNREEMSESLRGRKFSVEGRKHMSESKKDIKFSPETLKRNADARRGKKRSPESCKRMSDARKGKILDRNTKKFVLPQP